MAPTPIPSDSNSPSGSDRREEEVERLVFQCLEAPDMDQALAELRRDQPERARPYLNRLLGSDPTDPTTLYNLALACDADSDSESAERHLREFLRLAPHDPEAAKVRARLDTGSWGDN